MEGLNVFTIKTEGKLYKMLLKFIFGATMVAFTTFCGYLFARKYRQRKLFFAQFSEFNDRYISEISYSRRPIKTFISAYAYKGEFDTFLRKYFEVLESGQTRMHGFDFKTELSFLKQEERQIVLDYFIMLGKGIVCPKKGILVQSKNVFILLPLSRKMSIKNMEIYTLKLDFYAVYLF